MGRKRLLFKNRRTNLLRLIQQFRYLDFELEDDFPPAVLLPVELLPEDTPPDFDPLPEPLFVLSESLSVRWLSCAIIFSMSCHGEESILSSNGSKPNHC